jgi:hypothetical protein
MIIDWGSFVAVALASLISTCVVVGLYALATRLLAAAPSAGQKRVALIGAYTCFTLCGVAVLYGIYLIVPYFHQ